MINDKTQEEGVKEDYEKETLSDESPADEKPDDELIQDESSDQEPEVKETEEVIDDSQKEEPSPVEGETIRERALRKEVERLRGVHRKERQEELLNTEEKIEKIETKDVLSKYDQQELANLKEVLSVFADEFGFVRKNELKTSNYQQVADSSLDDFLQAHTEYLPENDKDNALWNSFKEEFSLYKQPENPKDLKRILERVHNSLTGNKSVNRNAVAAQQQKVKQAAHGGTTVVKTSQPKRGSVDSSVRPYLKGFSEEEIDELFT